MIRVANMERGKNALERRGCWIAVQVRGPGEADSGGSSSASDSAECKCRPGSLRWATTRDSRRKTSSPSCARSTLRRMWHRIPAGAARPSTPHHAPLRLCHQFAHQEVSRGVWLGHDPWPCCTRCVISGCPRSTGSSLSPWRSIYPPTEAAGGYGVIPGSHPIRLSGAESLPLATVICQRRAETGHHHGRKPGWAKPFSATC